MDPQEMMLNTAQAAECLGIAPQTLTNLRSTGGGPPYYQYGKRGKVVYRVGDLDDYKLAHRRTSTTDDGSQKSPL
jgi:hypothetical protein